MRTLTSLTLAILLVTTAPAGRADVVLPGGAFYDDDISVHAGSIEAIAGTGITRGCNPPLNTRFCPDRAVVRGEMAAFLSRAMDLPDAESARFVDTAASVFASDIDKLAAAGITRGCNPPVNDRFCPDRAVVRGEMAAFLARALLLPATEIDAFSDDDQSIFAQAINSLAAAGITAGCNPPANTHFCPTTPVTRAEMATFLTRALDLEVPVVPDRPHLVEVVPRSSWGARTPRGAFVSHQIDQLTVHHSDDGGSVTGPALYRIWQNWHLHLGWPDLAYHFIIGADGQVYEGRPLDARGDTATEYDPTGHLLIVVEGDFDVNDPTPAQLESLAQVVAWASMYFDAPTITGHRDHAATSCPGDHLYAHIDDGTLAERVAELLAEGGVTLRIGG